MAHHGLGCCGASVAFSSRHPLLFFFSPLLLSDGPPPVPQSPGAPMDIRIHDANRDYVIVSWKPPNTTTEGPIIGYFVDR